MLGLSLALPDQRRRGVTDLIPVVVSTPETITVEPVVQSGKKKKRVTKTGGTNVWGDASAYIGQVLTGDFRVNYTNNDVTKTFACGLVTAPSASNSYTDFEGLAHESPVANAVANGTFDSDTAWSKGTGWTISGGKANSSASTALLATTSVLENGRSYRIRFDYTMSSGSALDILFNGVSSAYQTPTLAASGSVDVTLTANGNGFALAAAVAAFTGTIDNIVVSPTQPVVKDISAGAIAGSYITVGANGDTFGIGRVGNELIRWRNGFEFGTRRVITTDPLYFDMAIYTVGGAIDDVDPDGDETSGLATATAPSFGAVGGHNIGSLSAPYPAGIMAGDLLILNIVKNGTDQTTAYQAAGWTEIGQFHNNEGAGTGLLALFYKVAVGTESGSFTPTQTGTAPTREMAAIEYYRGVDTSGVPYEGLRSGDTQTTGNSTVTTDPITTTADGRLLINKFYMQQGNLNVSPGPGWTEAWEYIRDNVGADYELASHYKPSVGVGLQDVEQAISNSVNVVMAHVSFALKGLPI